MAENSKIQWTTHTFNPWRGCTKVSPGCAHCYAEAGSKRNPTVLGVWGPGGTRVAAGESQWAKPLQWDRFAGWCGNPVCKAGGWGRTEAAVRGRQNGVCVCGLAVERPRVFCASLADVFEEWSGPMSLPNGGVLLKPYLDSENRPENWDASDIDTFHRDPQGWRLVTMGDVRARLFRLIADTPNLVWLLLTKRPEHAVTAIPFHSGGAVGSRSRDGLPTDYLMTGGAYLPNIWVGTSAENQAAADERIPHLLKVPAAVRFLSCEPLLGPVEFSDVTKRSDAVQQLGKKALSGIDWVIVGGESGYRARPCRVEWLRRIVAQCKAAGVACFVKQLGANPAGDTFPDDDRDPATGTRTLHVRQVLTVRDRKGGDIGEFPADLRVREFPTAGGT